MQTCITPIKPKNSPWKIATFDIETRDKTGGNNHLIGDYVLGATCHNGQYDDVKFHIHPLGIISEILKRGKNYRWFVHNGANFDFKYILNETTLALLTDQGYKAELIGGDIVKAICLRKKHIRIIICDSAKIMPDSLARLSKKMQVLTPKGSIDFDKEAFNENNPLHLDYLITDCVSLHQVVTRYRETIQSTFKSDLKCTASSTAFAAWRTTIQFPYFKHPKAVNDFARLSYYGGRTQIFFQGEVTNFYGVDVNSLYAYCLKNCGGLSHPFKTKEFHPYGFYKISAIVPDTIKFGPLPVRKSDNTGTIYPVGSFETYASSVEITQALSMGCSITIEEGYAFETLEKDLFKDFIAACERLRATDYDGPLGTCAKFLQNNLYGFFGMKEERPEFCFGDIPEDNPETWVNSLGANGEILTHLWERVTKNDSINCIPAVAAWITANARVYLLQSMLAEEAAGNEVLYCDTDSIMMHGKPVARIHATEYGAFKYVCSPTFPNRGMFIAPKAYMIVGSFEDNGQVKPYKTLVCKGIPKKVLTDEDFERALRGEKVIKRFTMLNSLDGVLRGRGLGTDEATRTLPIPANVKSMVSNGPDRFMSNVKLGN